MLFRSVFSRTLTASLLLASATAFAQSGIITTVAGNGTPGYTGDGGPALSATINWLDQIATDAAGNIYLLDVADNVVRKVNTSGVISTVAGNGTAAYSGDGGPATSASLNTPSGIAVDASGNLYIGDMVNNRIRKVGTDGVITTFAGTGTAGFSGDGGPASAAQLSSPTALCFDNIGNLFVIDFANTRIRKISSSGIITTVAGNGTTGSSGDGGPATSAQMFAMRGICADHSGNIYISDAGNYKIRKVNSAGVISTYCGTGFFGNSGDGGPATSAKIGNPAQLCADAAGDVYIADRDLNTVRKIDPSGTISRFAGLGANGFSGDGGAATAAMLYGPVGVSLDITSGRIVIADMTNYRIRAVSGTTSVCTLTQAPISITPNPSNGSFRLQVPSATAQNAQVIVTNVLGQRVAEHTIGTNKDETLHLDVAPGIYVLDVLVGGVRNSKNITILK